MKFITSLVKTLHAWEIGGYDKPLYTQISP